MASTLRTPKSYNVPHFIGKSHEIALNQSIEALLTSLKHHKSINLSSFTSDFHELMQAKIDPPLETIWVFAALSYNDPTTPKIEPLDRIQAVKDLFQLIVSCSAPCHSLKSIALVAPVIYILQGVIADLKGLRLGSKKEGKIKREIGSLVDSVIGYVSVCCNAFDGDFNCLEELIRPLTELVSVWIVDDGVKNKSVESLEGFFPLLNDGAVSDEVCRVDELAGYVVAEAFLLKVCWKIHMEGFGEKIQNELRSWIVGSVTGFQNSCFYVTLASMLLELALPTSSIMNLEHEDGLRKILFEALVLVEYSFLTPASLGQLPAHRGKHTILTKLLVTHEAIDLFTKRGEQTKTISYLNAYTNSSLPSLVIKLVRSVVDNQLDESTPNGSSPRAYLRWILDIEDRGVEIFEGMSRYRDKLISYNFEEETEQRGNGEDYFIDKKGDKKGQKEYGNGEDEKLSNDISDAFMAAARTMTIESSEHGGRKRGSKNHKKSKKVKYEYSPMDSSLPVERSEVSRSDDSNSEGEIDNLDSDEDMEATK